MTGPFRRAAPLASGNASTCGRRLNTGPPRRSGIHVAFGQALVLEGWTPSFLSPSQAQTIGFLGAFVFAIAIRMAGAIGEYKEQADALLAEQTMHALSSEAHHRAVVENAAEGILTISVDGTIGTFNAAAEAMFGWTATGNP